MNSYRVALIPGDGIGVDVVNEGCKVLDAVGKKFETQNYDLGANRYLKSGETLPDSVLAELKKFDAILLGAVGDPKVAPGICNICQVTGYVSVPKNCPADNEVIRINSIPTITILMKTQFLTINLKSTLDKLQAVFRFCFVEKSKPI